MKIQEDFARTVHMLQLASEKHPEVRYVLQECSVSRVAYLCDLNPERPGTDKQSILQVLSLEKTDTVEVNLPKSRSKLEERLKSTSAAAICRSWFITEVGTFQVLSDYAKTEYIGLILSPATLQQKEQELERLNSLPGLALKIKNPETENIFNRGRLENPKA